MKRVTPHLIAACLTLAQLGLVVLWLSTFDAGLLMMCCITCPFTIAMVNLLYTR